MLSAMCTTTIIAVTTCLLAAADGGALAGKDANSPMTAIWSKDKAWQWYRSAGVIRGCNYLPRSAVNMTEMWQRETFDPNTIDQELGWAKAAGLNTVRVFVQYLVWMADADGLKARFEKFLALAARHGIGVMPVLFCDCSFSGKEPYLGKQDEPIPGVHNSGWVPSPGLKRVTDRTAWVGLEKYVRGMTAAFARDRRVLMWDLYNEPGNSNMGDKSLPLVEATFAWARAERPSQPLTAGPWADLKSPMSRRMMELSDVVSFHGYDDPAGLEAKIRLCQSFGRPVVCTECLRRQCSNFRQFLPVFARHGVGWVNWGLVAGRTQTYMPWGSKRGDTMPPQWQHDLLHPDGRAYDKAELELIRAFKYDK
jgi:hypothetical protein